MILGLQVIKNLDFAQQVDDAEETQADYSHKLLFDVPDAVYWNGTQSQSYPNLVVSANTDLFCQGKAFLPRSIFLVTRMSPEKTLLYSNPRLHQDDLEAQWGSFV